MMTCDQIEASSIAEQYLTGKLSAAERDAFEEHYFECAQCFDMLQIQLAVQDRLRQTPAIVPIRPSNQWAGFAWVAIAAVVVIMASIGWWRFRIVPPQLSPPVARVETADPMELLARVDAPRYQAPNLRGLYTIDGNFRRAMEQYNAGNYGAAAEGLGAALKVDPQSSDAHFFLAICLLKQKQTDPAIVHLTETIRLGDSLNVEPAHFYLAKAYFQQKNAASAAAELKLTIAMHGDYEKQARELLGRLN